MTSKHIHIERILFPTDFSAFSSQALRHALALVRKFKARLKIIHVIPQMIQPEVSMYGAVPGLMTPKARQLVEQEMRVFLTPAREARIDHEVEPWFWPRASTPRSCSCT